MASFWSKFMDGIRAFRQAYVNAGSLDSADYGDVEARQFRYMLYWAFYENTIYSNVHKWSVNYRQLEGLYRYIRGIYNPSYRIGEFWRSHIWGGQLDAEAGSGEDGKDTAIPIITDNDDLRPAIANLWRWSNWQTTKGVCSLHGAVMGDVGIQVIDDVDRKKVYLQLVHPATLTDVILDHYGNIKGYTIEEKREHPDYKDREVDYKEIASRDGKNVVYKTFMNNRPYPWNGKQAEWAEPYGFIPMVLIQHNNVGISWGWSELHAGRGKFQEVDDLASKLGDQIRKMVDAPWLLAGVKKPRGRVRVSGDEATIDFTHPGREEIPILYADSGAQAHSLVTNLDIGATGNHIGTVLSELERDYPELQMDIWSASGNISGRALRTARQRVSEKVYERRAIYDDALTRVQMMALAIGGLRNYEDFKGLSLESYDRGALDHQIGDRPVFTQDPLDDIEVENEFWKAANEAIKAGLPLMVYLERQGWSKEDIKQVEDSEEYQLKLKAMKASAAMQDAMEGEGKEDEAPTDQLDKVKPENA